MPVYNTEKYIGKALDSILSQTFKDYEIILVNDGSRDGSATICESYKRLDNRIIYINKKNEGVSIARNKAIEKARGEYIIFVDSDDIVFPNTLLVVAQKLKETNADILRYEYQYIDKQGTNLYPNYNKKKRKKYVNQVMDVASFMQNIMLDEYFMCVNCYKNSIIDQYHLRLKEGCTYNEDTLFICQFLTHCNTLVYVPVVLYGYRKFSEAVTAKFTKKNFDDIKTVFYELIKLKEETPTTLSKEIETVIERLGLRLFQNASIFGKDVSEIIRYCITTPQIYEWNTYKILGSHSIFLWKTKAILNKISRRL